MPEPSGPLKLTAAAAAIPATATVQGDIPWVGRTSVQGDIPWVGRRTRSTSASQIVGSSMGSAHSSMELEPTGKMTWQQLRNLRKKLREVDDLERRPPGLPPPNAEQAARIFRRSELEAEIARLVTQLPPAVDATEPSLSAATVAAALAEARAGASALTPPPGRVATRANSEWLRSRLAEQWAKFEREQLACTEKVRTRSAPCGTCCATPSAAGERGRLAARNVRVCRGGVALA